MHCSGWSGGLLAMYLSNTYLTHYVLLAGVVGGIHGCLPQVRKLNEDIA